MTILNTFFDLPFETHRFEKLNGITVTIKYQGEEFVGVAVCHSDDEEFFSPIVGSHLAHLRAVRKMCAYYRDFHYNTYATLCKECCDAKQKFGDNEIFNYMIEKAEKRFKRYQSYTKQMDTEINNYIQNQKKVISSLRSQRKAKLEQ